MEVQTAQDRKRFVDNYRESLKERSGYLLLGCNAKESIIIDGDIKITLMYSTKGFAKIGISAPLSKVIFRENIIHRILPDFIQEAANHE